MLCRATLVAAFAVVSAAALPKFVDSEKLRIVSFWNQPDRYAVVAPPDAARTGPWQVRLAPAGSKWLWYYNKARGLSKGAPTSVPGAQNESQRAWESWIEAKIAFDKWSAGVTATENNRKIKTTFPDLAGAQPGDPGAIPAGLKALVGEAPNFAEAVMPRRHVVMFPDGESIHLNDNPPMRHRYAYYRFSEGVMSAGQRVRDLSQDEMDELFKQAGVNSSEQRVMKAVSMLEGGFDSVNTYDTGFVSVGLIQFACLSGGGGSLGSVLKRQKTAFPNAFERDFRQYGLDVTNDGLLVALDIITGDMLEGAEAAKKIIEDKRLIAVFQKAGRSSKEFRISQLQVAKEQYYPASDVLTVNANGETLTGRISDFISSEAVMATLMDRKVNTGKIDPLPAVVAQFASQTGAKSLSELSAYERDIVQAVKFRKDYLQDATLTQPVSSSRKNASSPSRGSRGTRSGVRTKIR